MTWGPERVIYTLRHRRIAEDHSVPRAQQKKPIVQGFDLFRDLRPQYIDNQ